MKKLDKRAHEEAMYSTIKAMDLHTICEVYGESGHSGNDCLETREDALNNNNAFRPQGDPGWNQSHPPYQEGNFDYNSNFVNEPSLIHLVLGQAQINENLPKKFACNDEIFENINSNLEGLTSSFTDQLSLNKMFEIQLARIATIILAYEFEKDPRATQNFS